MNFLSPAYLFDMRPGDMHASALFIYGFILLVFIAVMVVFSIVKKRKGNIYFKTWRSLNTFAISNFIIALFLLFFEYEAIYMFSARIWPMLWFVSMLVWLTFIFKEFKKIPEIKKEREKKREYEKYLP